MMELQSGSRTVWESGSLPPNVFQTSQPSLVAIGRPWNTIIHSAPKAAVRSPAVAQAIDDHGKPPPGVARLPGIKIMFLLVKPESMSAEDFHRYWIEVHAPLVINRSNHMAMRRYIQSHLIPSPMATEAAKARGWAPNPFQGVAEVWWDSEEAMAAAFSTPEGADAGEALAQDEKKFLDDRSLIVMTREYLIFDKS